MTYTVEVVMPGCQSMYLGPLTDPLPAAGAGAPGETVTEDEIAQLNEARHYVIDREDAHEFDTMKEAGAAVTAHAGAGVTFCIEGMR